MYWQIGDIYLYAKSRLSAVKAKLRINKKSKRLFKRYYSNKKERVVTCEKQVIMLFDGRIHHGGLADRIRGILSTYSTCKELGVTFKLYFNNPFKLEEFLIPNEYDWRISTDCISYNTADSRLIYAMDTNREITYKYITKSIKSTSKKQIHIYTNNSFIFNSPDGTYSRLFHELFKVSPPILNEITRYKEALAPQYISVSTRFLNLLGDFNENNSTQLNENEQEDIIEACIDQIERLHAKYPGHRMFVASDSYKFLCHADKKDYVTISGGKPIHIDNCKDNSSYDSHKKTFIDFFLIADADCVFMLHTGLMYKGNFAYSASLVNNRPYKLIEF